jgi:phosphatidylethanolamine/phosphatidyl-N-methylethanolamine N-methyltransferase
MHRPDGDSSPTFIGRFLANPRNVGAIAPSSAGLARLMLAAAGPALGGRVLELGAGTGAFTKALLDAGVAPERLAVVEADPVFAAGLRRRFAGIGLLQGDAFAPQTYSALAPFDVILSGLPLLNFSGECAAGLIHDRLAAASEGAPFVQFSYGLRPPVPPSASLSVTKTGRVWRNLPPAAVWVYRLRPAGPV